MAVIVKDNRFKKYSIGGLCLSTSCLEGYGVCLAEPWSLIFSYWSTIPCKGAVAELDSIESWPIDAKPYLASWNEAGYSPCSYAVDCLRPAVSRKGDISA